MPSSKFARQPNRAVPPPICIKPPQPPVDYPNALPPILLARLTWLPYGPTPWPFEYNGTFPLVETHVAGSYYGQQILGPVEHVSQTLVVDPITWETTLISMRVWNITWFARCRYRIFTPSQLDPYYTRNLTAYQKPPGSTVSSQITA